MNTRYKKMLDRMQTKEKKSRKKKEPWYLYILRCGDKSLYTGIAKDIQKRFQMHSKGKGARYTRSRQPLEIVYQEVCKSRTHALVRECFIKALPKIKKLALIQNNCVP